MMKKLFAILLTTILTATLTGCGTEKVQTKTCTLNEEGYEQIIDISATDNEIDKVKMTMIFDSEFLGVDSLSALTDDQKETIKANMLTTLGLENSTYEGFSIEIDITDVMTVVIDADIKKADEEVMAKVGLDFTGVNMDFETGVQDLIDNGAVCK